LIPFSDPSEPDHVFPWVNIGIIIINFGVFFTELGHLAQGQSSMNSYIAQYSLVPCEYTGHCSQYLYAGTPHPFFVTLITSMFLHAGWLHILGNMVFLWVFGDNIENAMGHFRYIVFYLVCGMAANGLEIATSVTSQLPGLGASGAIAGVLGAYLVLYPRSRIGTLIPISFFFIPVRLPAWVLIGFWFVLQLFNGIVVLSSRVAVGGVAYWAHIGGFTAGFLLIWVFRRPERVGQWRRYHHASPWARP
jgi:membrane associated rhomboid family serine protease